MLLTASQKLEAALAVYLTTFNAPGQRLEGVTLYRGQSTGERVQPRHVVIVAGAEGGPLAWQGMYDVPVELVIYRLGETQHPTAAAEYADTVESLTWIFRFANNAAIAAALQAIDPTLLVTGYWPEPRRDESSDEAFATVLPFSFHVCHAAN